MIGSHQVHQRSTIWVRWAPSNTPALLLCVCASHLRQRGPHPHAPPVRHHFNLRRGNHITRLSFPLRPLQSRVISRVSCRRPPSRMSESNPPDHELYAHDGAGAAGGGAEKMDVASDMPSDQEHLGEAVDAAMPLMSVTSNQLTLLFQGEVYVFDSVSPEKV